MLSYPHKYLIFADYPHDVCRITFTLPFPVFKVSQSKQRRDRVTWPLSWRREAAILVSWRDSYPLVPTTAIAFSSKWWTAFSPIWTRWLLLRRKLTISRGGKRSNRLPNHLRGYEHCVFFFIIFFISFIFFPLLIMSLAVISLEEMITPIARELLMVGKIIRVAKVCVFRYVIPFFVYREGIPVISVV